MSVFSGSFKGQLEHIAPLPQIAALEDARLFKLGQNFVNGCQTQRLMPLNQMPVDLVGSEMANRALTKHIKDQQARGCMAQHRAIKI